jgi:uracil-DNA glycosylase
MHIDSKKHLVLKAAHPSPFSADKGFFGCKHFSKTNEYLVKNGRAPIDWMIKD